VPAELSRRSTGVPALVFFVEVFVAGDGAASQVGVSRSSGKMSASPGAGLLTVCNQASRGWRFRGGRFLGTNSGVAECAGLKPLACCGTPSTRPAGAHIHATVLTEKGDGNRHKTAAEKSRRW
jgi:hypothetical protein